MKKLLIALITLLGLNVSAFSSDWFHLNLSSQESQVRLSFQKSGVAPTYGLPYGGTIARNLYIDLYNYGEVPKVKLTNKKQGQSTQTFVVKLVRDNSHHLYAKFELPYNQLYIEAEGEYSQTLELKYLDRVERFEINLMNAHQEN